MHSSKATLWAALIGLATAALMACDDGGSDTTPNGTGGSTTSSTSSGGGAGGGTGGSTTSSSSSGLDPTCQLPGCEPGFTTTHVPGVVGVVQAQLEDLSGGNPGEVMAEVCGFDVCHKGPSNASGAVSIDAGGDELENPHLQYGDGKEWVRMAVPLPQLPNHDFGTITVAPLPDYSAGVPFVAGQDLTQGDVTLSVPAEAEFHHFCMTYPEASQRVFRSVYIPPEALDTLPAVDPALNLEMLFGLAPNRTEICPAAGVTVPNHLGWTPDTAVEFYFHNTETAEDYAPFGGWVKVADGHVSSDGQTVSTDPGQGLGQLGLIGLRLAP